MQFHLQFIQGGEKSNPSQHTPIALKGCLSTICTLTRRTSFRGSAYTGGRACWRNVRSILSTRVVWCTQLFRFCMYFLFALPIMQIFTLFSSCNTKCCGPVDVASSSDPRVSGADISLALACSLLVDVHFFNATLRCTRYVTTQHLLRI